jgi:large subunit ribosomal protein L29
LIQENTMNAAELRQKDVAGLEAEVKDLQKAHFGLRMQKATQQLNNTSTLRLTRRDIARAKTVLAQKRAAMAGRIVSPILINAPSA